MSPMYYSNQPEACDLNTMLANRGVPTPDQWALHEAIKDLRQAQSHLAQVRGQLFGRCHHAPFYEGQVKVRLDRLWEVQERIKARHLAVVAG